MRGQSAPSLHVAGRATRAEYWYWIVPVVIINVVLGVVDQTLNPGSQMGALSWLTMIVFFASILPTLGVSIRRLHDIDRALFRIGEEHAIDQRNIDTLGEAARIGDARVRRGCELAHFPFTQAGRHRSGDMECVDRFCI